MNAVLPVLLAVAAGVSLIVQQALNANLRSVLGSAAWAGFASYLVGLASMALLIAILREPAPAWATVTRVPLWLWAGGCFGALFIALSIVLIPKLGAATFIALLVAGQMMAALAFDHYGWLGVPVHPATLIRLSGAGLLVIGVVLVRW